MKQCFVPKRFNAAAQGVIATANEIIADYQKDGFDLTLRQLYYQFVARGFIPNSDREYKNLGVIINDARMAGLVDWDAINDRTRYTRQRGSWQSPHELVVAAARGFHMNRWTTQSTAVEVWIEKDALIGVIEPVCNELDVLHFSCRGYVSQSTMYEAGQRMLKLYNEFDKPTVVLHLGDHDPSGIDMSRDIQDRLNLFTEGEGVATVERIALTMDQVRELNPPPNPAKLTDARCKGYIENYGCESWELDAIEPRKLSALVYERVLGYIDSKAWEAIDKQEEADKTAIMKLAAGLRA